MTGELIFLYNQFLTTSLCLLHTCRIKLMKVAASVVTDYTWMGYASVINTSPELDLSFFSQKLWGI